MTESAEPSTEAEAVILEVYVEAERPTACGRWEVLPGDTVRYVRPNGEAVQPAIVAASTLRTSPTWRRET